MRKLKWLPVLLLGIALGMGLSCWRQLGGIYREVTFRWETATEAERKVKTYADEKGISYGAYPESIIAMLEDNPETEQFVLEYPVYQPQPFDLEEYAGSERVPLFLQWDQRWGYQRYGSDCIGITGCGPTCLAMVGYYLTGDEQFSPDRVAAFAQENGYYASGYGSSWTLISEGAVKLGLNVTEIPLVKKRIEDNLAVGNPIICAMGAGDFTSTGHYIVIVGLEDGKYIINDPNSAENSARRWSYEQIQGQIRNLWVIR